MIKVAPVVVTPELVKIAKSSAVLKFTAVSGTADGNKDGITDGNEDVINEGITDGNEKGTAGTNEDGITDGNEDDIIE